MHTHMPCGQSVRSSEKNDEKNQESFHGNSGFLFNLLIIPFFLSQPPDTAYFMKINKGIRTEMHIREENRERECNAQQKI